MIKFESNYTDILKIEGILAKGFGHIPKFVMLDKDITLEAKTIYAYFSSYAGGGSTAFPSRDTITKHLKISKDRYYRHYNQLLDEGYIEVKQHMYLDEKTGENKLGNNVYTLISNPKKYLEQKKQNTENVSLLHMDSMRSYGYGTIPKIVMLDQRLNIKSKGIYAYFSSYAGGGSTAFPEVKNTLYFLRLSEKSYYKYLNELINYNYIVVEQRHENGRLSSNNYYLIDNPDIGHSGDQKLQSSKNKDTGRKLDIPTSVKVIHNKKLQSSKLQSSKNEDTQNEDTQNKDTYNTNNTNTNNININQSFKTPERMADNQSLLKDQIIEEMLLENTLPFRYTQDFQAMEIAIKYITFYEDEVNNHKNAGVFKNELEFYTYKLFVEALIEMLTDEYTVIQRSRISSSKIYEQIKEFLKTGSMEGTPYIYLHTLKDVAVDDYIKACSDRRITYPKNYMKSVIWNATQKGSIDIASEVKRMFKYR